MFILVLQAAVISLGLIGAGTNNARIAGMLRNLSRFYDVAPGILFCVCLYCTYLYSFLHNTCAFAIETRSQLLLQVRIAQGLVHMGKGLLTLNPYHSDRFLCSP